ncbi:hypothetical protein [Niastella populi]|uniref:hypothetical protein n=1 Tax=Niastella populi TaxID=550983 RepID=UPI0013FDD61C|nr:hypothetical protein [Niastella populi]
MSSAAINKIQTNVTIVKKLRDYSKDPVIRKKVDEAKKIIKKYGIPDSFKKKK